MKTRETIYNNTYGFTIHLLWPATPKQFARYVCKVTKRSDYKNPGSFLGICHATKDGGTIIIGLREFNDTPYDLGTLAHELIHGVSYSLRTRGIKLSKKTEECYAYLYGSLFDRCVDLIRRNS